MRKPSGLSDLESPRLKKAVNRALDEYRQLSRLANGCQNGEPIVVKGCPDFEFDPRVRNLVGVPLIKIPDSDIEPTMTAMQLNLEQKQELLKWHTS